MAILCQAHLLEASRILLRPISQGLVGTRYGDGTEEGILHAVFRLSWLLHMQLSMRKVCWYFAFLFHARQHWWAAGTCPGKVAQTRPHFCSPLPHVNELPIITLPSPWLFEQNEKWLSNLPCILLRKERTLWIFTLQISSIKIALWIFVL